MQTQCKISSIYVQSLVDVEGIVSRDQVAGTKLCVEFWYQIPVSSFL